ncbi:hypothetical protein F0562_033884 [Nyssa sinensis]|uniref:Rapid ALkalinization Factor n=1 Tax=Nyssa sinensis TaxID=561372 RepID=A0A5J5AIP3_9ASTE|nr:hypothetical protein F0562_033884 [Nyssa sinensis]
MGMEQKLQFGLLLSAVLVMIFSASGDDVHSSVALQKMMNENNCTNGRIAECYRDEEFFMESGVSRQLLQNKQGDPISYGALKGDKAFCKPATPSYRSCTALADRHGGGRGCQANASDVHSVSLQKIMNENNCSHGRIADCYRDEEFFMESGVSRQLLQTTKGHPISYDVVNNANKPFCKGSTPDYRSCTPPPKGSGRGCSSIYRCRSGVPNSP